MAPKLKAVDAVMPAKEQTTTVSGYAIQILAFIPIGKKDLKKQAEIPVLLMDIIEGRKTIADLAEHLHELDMRQQYTNKRFEIEKAKVLLGEKPTTVAPKEEPKDEQPTAAENEGEPLDRANVAKAAKGK